MPRITIHSLVTKDLGYCCLYAFFRLYRQTGVIATRLGVTDRAIRKHKEAFRAGELRCGKCKTCMLPALRRNLK